MKWVFVRYSFYEIVEELLGLFPIDEKSKKDTYKFS